MEKDKRLQQLQNEMSYIFRNISLLKQALVHSSYANENKLYKIDNNERLEFLGDAVLEVITSNFLFHQYPDMLEGELTKRRASIVCEPTLAKLCVEMKLGDHLLLGKGEENSGGRERASVLSDFLEALIGAIYLDGGLQAANDFVTKKLLTKINHQDLFVDSKTHLQEIIQKNSDQPLEYLILSEKGPDHSKIFEVVVKHRDNPIGYGSGKSKKNAEQQAAFDAIHKMKVE